MEEAKSGKGVEIIKSENIHNPKYKGKYSKKSHVHYNPDGSITEIHYWEEVSTGKLSGFKFKKP